MLCVKLISICFQPKAFYCIPTHHNPTGSCLDLEERLRVISLCRVYNVTLVADETYQLLNLGEFKPPPFMMQLDSHGGDESSVVLSVSSFSKILAPATRLGFVWSRRKDWIQKLGDAGIYQSGSNNNLMAAAVDKYVRLGSLYCARCAALTPRNSVQLAR